jgi:hypothetical protein
VKFSDSFSTQKWYTPNSRVIAAVPEFPADPEQVSQILSSRLTAGDKQVYLFDYLGDLTDPHREVDVALVNLGYQLQKTINFEGVGFIHLFKRI